MRATSTARGFTLVELVTAISVGAIVVSFAAIFITGPVDAYEAQTRRAALVDSADAILRLMSRDVRGALPNSLRITTNGNVVALELLSTVDAVRYRDDDAATTAADDELDFSAPDDSFSTIGSFQDIPRVAGTFTPPRSYRLSIYNVGVAGANTYEQTNVITPEGAIQSITSTGVGTDRVTLNPSMQFAYGSPAHRVYLVSGPVTYLCDTGAHTVRRYEGYAISNAQPTSASDMAGASVGLVSTKVKACTFAYAAGTAERAGLVTLDVTVEDVDSTEHVRLLHQVHVENVP